MKAFFTSFKSFFESTQLYTQLAGEMYVDGVPDDTPAPYAVWSFPSMTASYDLADLKDEHHLGQLDIYAAGKLEAAEIYDQAETDFNNCTFAIPGFSLERFRLVDSKAMKQGGTYRYIMEFSIEIGVI